MDEVCDSRKRSIFEDSPQYRTRIVLPLEGKGDRSAVDEVKMRTVSLSRSVIAYCLSPKITKNPNILDRKFELG